MAARAIYETTFDENESLPFEYTECPECEGDLQRGETETTCTDCGLVVAEHRIDHGPEWRLDPETEHERRRTGPQRTVSRHDRGLSTTIGYGGDSQGRPLSGRKRRQLVRLRREHTRATMGTTRDRNLVAGFVEIRRVVSALDLSKSVRDEACAIFRVAQAADVLVGRSLWSVAPASVYAVCRCRGLPRTREEFEEFAACSRTDLNVAYRELNRTLGLPAKLVTPAAFVPRLASEFEVPDTVRREATRIADQVEASGLATSRKPAGVAAASLHLAGRQYDLSLTQAALARAAHVTTSTVRKNMQEIEEELG